MTTTTKKKTALITGCSSGFGKLTAKTFHDHGWNVIATMRTPERETELTQLDGLLVMRLDVTDPESIRGAVAEGLVRFGGIDALVNNAGYGGHALFEQMPDDAVRRMYETNVFGVMNATRSVLPLMRRQRSGRIINVTSGAGMIGAPGISVYCSTKFAVEGLTEALAHEYRPWNIRAMTVAPGAYDTGFTMACDNDGLAAGDQELAAFAQELVTHMQSVIPNFRPEGSAPADPQEVANKIYECATSDTPIHNPVGSDAERIAQMKESMPQQVFLDQLAAMLLPPTGAPAGS